MSRPKPIWMRWLWIVEAFLTGGNSIEMEDLEIRMLSAEMAVALQKGSDS